MKISGYDFEGPFMSAAHLRDQSGVYVILGRNGNTNWYVVDVGESTSIKSRVENHDRKMCWSGQYNNLSVAVFYTDKNNRLNIETQIRQQYAPPCAVR